jgi:protein-disulfide isomerase
MYIIGGLAALVAVLFVISLGALARGGDGGFSGTVVVPAARPSDIAQSGHVYGDGEAPVTVSEYLDFQCPFCRRAATDVMKEIEERFIAGGEAKVEVHPIAILGEESVQAAAAAECANAQGRFWSYHDILFTNQGAEQSGSFSKSRLKEFAARLGMDTSAFNGCLDSQRYVDQVEQSTEAARASGIASTPTFLVNGTPVASTVDALAEAISRAAGD